LAQICNRDNKSAPDLRIPELPRAHKHLSDVTDGQSGQAAWGWASDYLSHGALKLRTDGVSI